MFSVPPTTLTTPVEEFTNAVLSRVIVVQIPLLKFSVPVAPDTSPIWLSWGKPWALVFVNVGPLEPTPKLNVPELIWKSHGTVIGAEAALSTNVQLAFVPFKRTVLVPPGTFILFRRFVNVPVPANVSVV